MTLHSWAHRKVYPVLSELSNNIYFMLKKFIHIISRRGTISGLQKYYVQLLYVLSKNRLDVVGRKIIRYIVKATFCSNSVQVHITFYCFDTDNFVTYQAIKVFKFKVTGYKIAMIRS